MAWLEFISRIVASTAWPAVVIVAVVVFRRELRGAFRSLQRIKYREFEAEFSKKAAELEAKATALGPPSAAQMALSSPMSADEVLESLLQTSPRVAVVEAFGVVERAIQEAALRHGLTADRFRGVRNTLRDLEERHLIPDDVKFLFNDLRTMRNNLAHAHDVEIPEADARRYINASGVLAGRISQL